MTDEVAVSSDPSLRLSQIRELAKRIVKTVCQGQRDGLSAVARVDAVEKLLTEVAEAGRSECATKNNWCQCGHSFQLHAPHNECTSCECKGYVSVLLTLLSLGVAFQKPWVLTLLSAICVVAAGWWTVVGCRRLPR